MAEKSIQTKTYRIKRDEDIDEAEDTEEVEETNFKPVITTLKIIG